MYHNLIISKDFPDFEHSKDTLSTSSVCKFVCVHAINLNMSL